MWHLKPDDIACHNSTLVLALQRGYLKHITLPIHRFLISSGGLRPNVRPQYLQDMREIWIFDPDPMERHRKFRSFWGRITELQFALWLETISYEITGLEALNGGPDIEACEPNGGQGAFELKFIGTEDSDFEMILRSISGAPEAYSISPYTAMNYLLFRAYEAAQQLRPYQGSKTAVAIIDAQTWWRFDVQLKYQWIDWRDPTFIGTDPDPQWATFIAGQLKKYPGLYHDIGIILGQLDSVWIVRQTQYEFELVHSFGASSA